MYNGSCGLRGRCGSIDSVVGTQMFSIWKVFGQFRFDVDDRFNNGWLIKIGRGLDYFKRVDQEQIGFVDMDFRPCLATTIDIVYANPKSKKS